MGKDKKQTIRLDRLLSNLGYGGRKEMTMAIKNEWLEIDGTRVTNPSLSIDIDLVKEGRVLFDGQPLDPITPFSVMFHKPAGYTCSHKDPGAIVYDILPARWRNRKPTLSMVGRLDKESTGMLLFTDDGDLLHRIISPKIDVPKQYHVTLRDDLKGNEAELFASGDLMLTNEEKPLKPAFWTPINNKEGTMILHEGRFRQIRRMFHAVDNDVIGLHRTQIGGLSLGDLPEGQWRALDHDDLAKIF